MSLRSEDKKPHTALPVIVQCGVNRIPCLRHGQTAKVDGCQSPYLDVGLTQVKVTPLVGRDVPLCNSVCTANGQVIVHAPEVMER